MISPTLVEQVSRRILEIMRYFCAGMKGRENAVARNMPTNVAIGIMGKRRAKL